MDNLFKKKSDTENIPKPTYEKEIEKIALMDKDPKRMIELLDLLAKDYFRKKYHLKKSMEYSEMATYFKTKERPDIESFCQNMIEALYSGDYISSEKATLFLENFIKIIKIGEIKIPTLKKGKEIKFSSLLKSNKKISPINDSYVSKDVRSAIENEYETVSPKNENLNGIENSSFTFNVPQTESLPINNNQNDPELEKSISSIDDLARIKERIQEKRKREIKY